MSLLEMSLLEMSELNGTPKLHGDEMTAYLEKCERRIAENDMAWEEKVSHAAQMHEFIGIQIGAGDKDHDIRIDGMVSGFEMAMKILTGFDLHKK